MTDRSQSPALYEAPVLSVLGTVHTLTLDQNKDYGVSDGFKFQGIPVTNVSG
jgi:hypothetical protein